ncbi:hypothetical protein RRG08_038257 [Elysia crispata]|uniref:Uncharacterized protein n=1 Tax=Elysia crispata TaxID=231223 RepID=A0AAE1AP73_9GAST|nr:hypothetical protein RRG08_038257 [Elysia crispata]
MAHCGPCGASRRAAVGLIEAADTAESGGPSSGARTDGRTRYDSCRPRQAWLPTGGCHSMKWGGAGRRRRGPHPSYVPPRIILRPDGPLNIH